MGVRQIRASRESVHRRGMKRGLTSRAVVRSALPARRVTHQASKRCQLGAELRETLTQ